MKDNTINQRVLKRQLISHHFDVSIANNGQEALDALQAAADEQSEPIDIVLMDIEMEIMNGLEAIRESSPPFGRSEPHPCDSQGSSGLEKRWARSRSTM